MRRADSESAAVHVRGQANLAFGVIGGSLVQARDIGELHVHVLARRPTPRQLPPAPRPFVNRERETALMDAISAPGDGHGSAPVLLLTGGHGVGKSAIGRHWAHVNSGRFGDGQLYVDLGALRSGGVVSVRDVLGVLLGALGVEGSVLPASLADRTALFRSRLADRQVLILVDDARFAAEVAPLVPANAGCCVVVTTRSAMRELVVDGAGVVHLNPLDDVSAELLLVEMLGPERVGKEPDAVARLRTICAGLPVALRICAALLAGRHARRTIAWLVERLEDEQRRLARLSDGSGRSLEIVFDDAYADLEAGPASLYLLLGAMPVAAPSPWVLESVSRAVGFAVDVGDAIEGLEAGHLVEETSDGRLVVHDLLRTHAREVARRQLTVTSREDIVAATIEMYVARARQMDVAIVPDRLRFGPAASPRDRESPFEGPAAALAWFERERANLLAVLDVAETQERFDAVWQLAEAMWIAYNNHKHLDEARVVYAKGVRAADRGAGVAVRARMRQQLARAETELGDFVAARTELRVASELTPEHDLRLRGSILEFEGVLEIARGDHEAAIPPLKRALTLFSEAGFRRGVALQHYMLGRAYVGAGSPDRGVQQLLRARELVNRDHDLLTYGRVLLRLGAAQRAAGDLEAAASTLGDAASTMRRADALIYVAEALVELGEVRRAQGALDLFRRELGGALELFDALGSSRAMVIRERLDHGAA